MRYLELGKSGIKISKIGLGTWQIGSSYWGWGKEFDRNSAIRVIKSAIDHGINFIDTAESYGGGLSETIIGEAVKEMREDVIIATKVSPSHLTYRGVKKALRRSLSRLKTKYVDLYQVHWPNPLIPIKGTMRAMEELIDEGKVRTIGVSNFSLKRLQKARNALKRHDLVSNQIEYNLLRRDPERELIPYCNKEGLTVIAYSPLAQGLLTGKYGPGKAPKGFLRRNYIYMRYGRLSRISNLLSVLEEISMIKGASISQIALGWVIRHPNVVAIPGAKREEHVKQNAEASSIELGEDELEMIERRMQTSKVRANPAFSDALSVHPTFKALMNWLNPAR